MLTNNQRGWLYSWSFSSGFNSLTIEDTLLQEFASLGKYESFTDFIEDASWNEKCEECARRALSALFPDENVADVHSIFERDYLSGLVGSAMELADRYGHLADVMEKGTSLLDAAGLVLSLGL